MSERQYRGQNDFLTSAAQGGGAFSAVMVVMAIFGLVLAIGPWFAPFIDSSLAKLVCLVVGLVITFLSLVLVVWMKLYRKAPPNRAFVRSGRGGATVVKSGGSIVIPVLHEVVDVPLEQMTIPVERKGDKRVQTKDPLFAEVTAACYVVVEPDDESIRQAATTLGSRLGNSHALQEFLEALLDGAVRGVCARQDFTALNSDRKAFAKEVQDQVAEDLKKAGLTLKALSITDFRQVPIEHVAKDESPLNAEVFRFMTEQIQAQRVKSEQARLSADQAVSAQKVETAKVLAKQKVDETTATAQADLESKNIRAKADREAAEVAAEQKKGAEVAQAAAQRDIEKARVEREQAVAIAETAKAKAAETAEIEKLQSVETATVAKQQAVEVARQDQLAAISAAETKVQLALAQQREAEAKAQEAQQSVTTVQVLAEAKRTAEQTVIQQEAQAKRSKIEQETAATVAAFKITTQAQAEQDAAEKQAAAKILLARASKDAEVLEAEGHALAQLKRAEGDQAIQMVPVRVESERVTVKSQEVDVEIRQLEARSKNTEVSIKLETALAQIAADSAVDIERAKAAGQALAEIKVLSGAAEAQTLMGAMIQGQRIERFIDNLPPEAKSLQGAIGTAGIVGLAKLVETVGGVDRVKELLASVTGTSDTTAPKAPGEDSITR
jgi:uncharacterized membrane protein YqiK